MEQTEGAHGPTSPMNPAHNMTSPEQIAQICAGCHNAFRALENEPAHSRRETSHPHQQAAHAPAATSETTISDIDDNATVDAAENIDKTAREDSAAPNSPVPPQLPYQSRENSVPGHRHPDQLAPLIQGWGRLRETARLPSLASVLDPDQLPPVLSCWENLRETARLPSLASVLDRANRLDGPAAPPPEHRTLDFGQRRTIPDGWVPEHDLSPEHRAVRADSLRLEIDLRALDFAVYERQIELLRYLHRL